MNLQLKSLSGQLTEEQKKYLRKQLLWFEKHLPNNATLTVGVHERITKKSNQAHEIFLHLTIPGVKKMVYIKVFKNYFNEAVDIAREKLERIVLKNKEKRRFSFKLPRLPFSKQ